ncbi:hypothetical protein [Paracoccus fontiphilus]|uniref:Uncharacterized protein n=1 Tax=Paracoccus fontiphilus TaxID=1815556 RepID=A0ABV7IHB6_9RHOB|nr:hypothetical protein [Paracoccus fontiphilus]
MALISGFLAIIITAGYLAVIYAFRASFRELKSATWWFAMGFAILAGAIILRAMYWDVALPLLRLWYPETAAAWSEATRGRMINTFFSLLKMSSFFCALKCREALIPPEERHLWPWWKSWMHPHAIRLLPWSR